MSKLLRVLQVEDSESNAALNLRLLTKAGYDVCGERVETASEMQAALGKDHWDVIIADYRLPQFDAPSALVVLQQMGLDIPFIVVSGTIGEEIAVRMMKSGAHDYLMKNKLSRLVPAVEREIREADIRQKKRQAEEDLRESEQFAHNTIDALLGHLCVLDETGTIITVNEAWRDFAEANPPVTQNVNEGANYLEVCDAASGEDAEIASAFAVGIRAVIREESEVFVLEYPCHSPSVQRWFNGRVSRFHHQTPTHIVVYHENITSRKIAEETVRISEAKYRNLFESMRDAFVRVTMDGRICEFNEVYRTMLGYEREELLSLTYQDVTPEKWRGVESDILENQILKRNFSDIYEKEYQRKDGVVFPVELRTSLLRDLAGNPIGMWALVRDITDRKNLEAQLAQAQKMEAVGRLAGGVAHDFNNILCVILGYTAWAMEKVDPADPLHSDLEEVLAAAMRSRDIIRQLLAFARKQTILPEVVDLNSNVENMLKMLRRLIGEDIDLVWHPGAELWPVKIDPSQIDQILANLCVNARDAIRKTGKVTIETGKVSFDQSYSTLHKGFIPGEFVLLAVSDDGCGMDKNTLAKVFEPFFTTKETGRGTGLGLATVYGIVKQNNGFINVYSEPGEGTSFKIYLPRQMGQATWTQVESAREIPRGQGETLLVAEDDGSILQIVKRVLSDLGYNVLSAGTPNEAIRLAEAHAGEIHLLITDVIMPKTTGRELATRLQSIRPEMRCLFMSGYTADVIFHRGVLENGVQFLQKPFSTKDLATKVRMVLDQK